MEKLILPCLDKLHTNKPPLKRGRLIRASVSGENHLHTRLECYVQQLKSGTCATRLWQSIHFLQFADGWVTLNRADAAAGSNLVIFLHNSIFHAFLLIQMVKVAERGVCTGCTGLVRSKLNQSSRSESTTPPEHCPAPLFLLAP